MSATLARAEVERIAALARLALSEEELALFGRQLGDILAWANAIQDLDTAGVPPTGPVAGDARLRADEPRPSLSRDEALGGAPDADRDAGLFRVPRVLG
jgi:aspartyl-tRNA(Asn)/glutamyl-tRNA(Gln) amidotransferase subunit C